MRLLRLIAGPSTHAGACVGEGEGEMSFALHKGRV